MSYRGVFYRRCPDCGSSHYAECDEKLARYEREGRPEITVEKALTQAHRPSAWFEGYKACLARFPGDPEAYATTADKAMEILKRRGLHPDDVVEIRR